MRGGAVEGRWGGGGSCPLTSQYLTPLPSSDDTAADPAASNIADIAFAGAALAIGSDFASATLAIGSVFAGGASTIGSSIANCHSGDYQHAAIITHVAAYANAHYRGSPAGCAPCYWTANTASMAGGIRLLY
jgi:hypothetical protein